LFDGDQLSEQELMANPKLKYLTYATSIEPPNLDLDRDVQIISSLRNFSNEYFVKSRGLPSSMSVPLNKIKE